jgi:multiple sugar transport system permease protein
VLIVVGQTITCTLSGYAFVMVSFPGKNTIFSIFLATMMVPIQTIIIPVFVIVKDMGLSGSISSLIVPALASAFGTFLMRQYFLQMPRELGEAARIDGATQFGVFWHVYARMATPAIATLAILNFSGFWAEYYRPLIFLNQQNTFTLPLGLVGLQGNLGTLTRNRPVDPDLQIRGQIGRDAATARDDPGSGHTGRHPDRRRDRIRTDPAAVMP